jgi:two-component system, sensor histidine kinase and response regulator
MTDPTGPLLDPAQVADLVALDPSGALFAQFVDLFVAGAGDRIAQIGRHAAASKGPALADAAHALRGAAGNVGATRFARLCERIEVAAKTGDFEAARATVVSLDEEFSATRAALLAAAGKSS